MSGPDDDLAAVFERAGTDPPSNLVDDLVSHVRAHANGSSAALLPIATASVRGIERRRRWLIAAVAAVVLVGAGAVFAARSDDPAASTAADTTAVNTSPDSSAAADQTSSPATDDSTSTTAIADPPPVSFSVEQEPFDGSGSEKYCDCTLPELIGYSDLVFIGTAAGFVPGQVYPAPPSPIDFAQRLNLVSVDQVLSGDAQVGSIVSVIDNGWDGTGTAFRFANLRWLEIGERAIYFVERIPGDGAVADGYVNPGFDVVNTSARFVLPANGEVEPSNEHFQVSRQFSGMTSDELVATVEKTIADDQSAILEAAGAKAATGSRLPPAKPAVAPADVETFSIPGGIVTLWSSGPDLACMTIDVDAVTVLDGQCFSTRSLPNLVADLPIIQVNDSLTVVLIPPTVRAATIRDVDGSDHDVVIAPSRLVAGPSIGVDENRRASAPAIAFASS